MGPLKWFLCVYLLGGITFVPIVLVCTVVIIYLTSPLATGTTTTTTTTTAATASSSPAGADNPADLTRDHDDKDAFKTGTDDLADKFHRKHDGDVAASYFAVCREFVPGGVRGRPPEKPSAAGEASLNDNSSPSVYQTMYRSIFDRPQKPTIEPQQDAAAAAAASSAKKNAKKANKPANNIFYVVLRHGHLMLYDDNQQLEVRYVISLDYHDVDIYSGTDEPIPEGELWAKRHAIRLRRKPTQQGDRGSSLPFFLFSEYCSSKEDFYFALLRNQRRTSDDVPEAETFDVKHIVSLVQKLHSSEEHLATRWLNALIGRLFLALYRTDELEDFVRSRLTKKLSRVKKPNFITRLALRKVDLGTGAPFITNPRLKDLTVNGDCTVEADVDYSGNFRIELGATARIDLGARFKPRDVDLVLTVTVKQLRGHGLLHVKPPPSNRVWITFEKMPHLELAVEPVVSSRQITLTLVLRAIESRIREVVAESLVLPFWDDVPFLLTFNQKYRGGIWKHEEQVPVPEEANPPDDLAEDDAEVGRSGQQTPEQQPPYLSKEDRNLTMPILLDGKKFAFDRKSASISSETATSPPRLMRSSSVATAADPKITIDNADNGVRTEQPAEASKRDSTASMVLKDLTARSSVDSSSLSKAIKRSSDSLKSKASSESISAAAAARQSIMNFSIAPKSSTSKSSTPRSSVTDLTQGSLGDGLSGSPGPSTTPKSRPASLHGEAAPSKTPLLGAKSFTAADRKQAVASAQAGAQKWSTMGWGVLARNRQQGNKAAAVGNGRPTSPMGRGQPLPPPGQPLPAPPKPLTIAGMANSMLPRRRPALAKKGSDQTGSTESVDSVNNNTNNNNSTNNKTPVKTPTAAKQPPPSKRKEVPRASYDEDEVMVVAAPVESLPATPAVERKPLPADVSFVQDSYFPPTLPTGPSDQETSEDTTTGGVSASVPASPGIEDVEREPATPSQKSSRLPSRQSSMPATPSSASGRQSPMTGGTLAAVEVPLVAQAADASSRERSLSYMEATSGSGGYNE